MKTIKTIEQMVEALGYASNGDKTVEQAIQAGRALLEQLEELKQSRSDVWQEPVAYVTGVYAGRFTYAPVKASVVLPVGMAFYTGPQPAQPKRRPSDYEWVGLTEKEILECRSVNHLYFYQAIETKLMEKNT